MNKIKNDNCPKIIRFIILSGLIVLLAQSWLSPASAGADPYNPDQVWSELLERNPFPYRIPLAEAVPTPIDGTYTRTTPIAESHIPCRRCADWRPEGGVWKINFSRGIFRIMHRDTAWKNMGSYYIAKDRIIFANDPVCHDEIGVYKWIREENQIRFELIDDDCAIKLRAANLTRAVWASCRPPNREAAISSHWLVPEGCE